MFVVIRKDDHSAYYSGLMRSRPVWVKDILDAMIYDKEVEAKQVADTFDGLVKRVRDA